MAFGVNPQSMDANLQAIQEMAPGDLQALLESMQEETDEIPEGHLLSYMDECVRESYEATKTRRKRWDELWRAHESEFDEQLQTKEDWQSTIVLNKPFSTTVQAKSLVRRALMERPDYFTLDPTDPQDPVKKLKTDFWSKALRYWVGTEDAYLPLVFADAAHVGFSLGSSAAVKILWRPDQNGIFRLMLDKIPPWQLYGDPDRKPRHPWSGLYCIHEEWVDYHLLLEMAEQGFYDLDKVKQVRIGRQVKDGAGYSMEDREQERRRKGQVLHRNKFRYQVLVRELWGGLLDQNGEMLMSDCRYTSANQVIIRTPRPKPFRRLRWPWVEFSPLPHPFRFEGYGLYEGVLALWKFQNALLNLYIDNENWRINNMYEIDPTKLEDPTDQEVYPGKNWFRKRGAEQGPAVTPVLKGPSNIADVQFLWELASRQWEEGSFLTESLKGQVPEERKRTLGELQMNYQSSVGVFDSIGRDTERGGVQILWAIKEVLTTFWDDTDHPGLRDVFGEQSKELYFLSLLGELSPQQRIKALELDNEIKMQGVSRLFDRADLIEKLKMLVVLGDNPRFTHFMKDYDLAKRIFDEFNQGDLLKTEEELQQDAMAQMGQQREQIIQESVDRGLQAAEGERQGDKQHQRDLEKQAAKRPPSRPVPGPPRPLMRPV